MKCPFCGNEVDSSFTTCPYCSNTLNNTPPQQQNVVFVTPISTPLSNTQRIPVNEIVNRSNGVIPNQTVHPVVNQSIPQPVNTIQSNQPIQVQTVQPVASQPVIQPVNTIQSNQQVQVQTVQPVVSQPVIQPVNTMQSNQPIQVQTVQPVASQPIPQPVNTIQSNQQVQVQTVQPVVSQPVIQPVNTMQPSQQVQDQVIQTVVTQPMNTVQVQTNQINQSDQLIQLNNQDVIYNDNNRLENSSINNQNIQPQVIRTVITNVNDDTNEIKNVDSKKSKFKNILNKIFSGNIFITLIVGFIALSLIVIIAILLIYIIPKNSNEKKNQTTTNETTTSAAKSDYVETSNKGQIHNLYNRGTVGSVSIATYNDTEANTLTKVDVKLNRYITGDELQQLIGIYGSSYEKIEAFTWYGFEYTVTFNDLNYLNGTKVNPKLGGQIYDYLGNTYIKITGVGTYFPKLLEIYTGENITNGQSATIKVIYQAFAESDSSVCLGDQSTKTACFYKSG